jgi:hypothetical protein
MAAKTGTYTLINSSTLTSATANVTFSSIPATYTDLLLIINAQSVQATTYDNVIIQFNADTGSNYSRTRINAYSGGVAGEFNGATTSHLVGPITGTSFSSSIFSPSITNILDYANTTTYKTALWRSNSQDGYVQLGAGLWSSTSAIASIKISTLSTSNLASGSTFKLYGIEAGNL